MMSLALAGSLLLSSSVAPSAAVRDDGARGLLFGSFANESGSPLLYSLYVPRDYDPARRWPLVLFLHGRGESGTDGLKPAWQGLGDAIFGAPERWPVVALFPQKSDPDSEWEQLEAPVMALVEAVRSAYAIDPERVALTGLSQGGHGAWVLGARHAALWSAVVPVCGYPAARSDDGRPGRFTGAAAELAKPLAAMPLWAFHSEDDPVVPVAGTKALVEAMRAAGGTPRLTLYDDAGHGAWLRAYWDEELPRWLLAERRRESEPPGATTKEVE